ncbi:MAG: aminopeptidase P family protein [Deltaproteobacteria bacterium]|nr:aminopeptidase P family protein [Deltaproteobacteria bacterium]
MALVKLEEKDFVTDVPRYPDFPQSEWKRRINRAKELMVENEIDALVLWKRENVRYFFGFQTTHWEIPSIQPAVGIIPVDGDPIIVTSDIVLVNAQVFCWTRDVRYQARAHEVPKERAFPGEIAAVLKEIGCGNKNIALEMGELGCMWIPRPLNDIESFKAALPDARFVAGDKVIWGCRMIKSPLEIERIRQSVRVLTKCHSKVVEEYRPGMDEMDIGKIIHRVQVEEGDFRGGDTTVCHHIICNLEKEGVCDCLSLDDVPIGKNDYIQVDLQHKHRGYWGDIARIFQVGPITDRIKRNYDICREGLEVGATMIKPGTKINEVYKAAVKPVEEAGVRPLEMAGHGIGLDIHEPPSVDITNEMAMEVGMVFALEVWFLTSFARQGGEGIFGFEDQYVVTDTGYERIEGLSKDIIQVSNPIC